MMFNDDKRTIVLTLIVAALILFAPVMAKWVLNQDSYLSEETYYNLRIVDQFKENGVGNQDLLQNKKYEFNLFHYIFYKLDIGENQMAKYLPALLGVLSLFLLYLLLKKLNLGQNDVFFSLIILATTPIFLYEFTTFSPEILALPILLIGLILFIRGNYVSSLFLGATALFNVMYALIALILIVADHLFKKRNKMLLAINVVVIVGTLIVGALLLDINYFSSFIPSLVGLNGFLIEFGALKGYALVTVGLAMIGLFSWWNKDSKKTTIMISVIVLIVVAALFEDIRLPISIIIAIFGGFSISYLVNREWEIFVLKEVTLLLIVCILIFSAVLTLNFQIKNINDEKVSAIAYLSSAGRADTVLSSERNGFIIEYVSGRSAYLDGNSYKFDDYAERQLLANKIYYSRNLNELERLLRQEKITHILIDSEMREGEVWNGRAEGVLFFLENSEKFIKIYFNDKIQIYRYVGEEIK
ncbi:MAG: hypothetical protein ACP5N2_02550 [Candidatus Nanoarchaeia archaeon]